MTQSITIQNQRPRLDINGQPIDCHDGCLRLFAGRFYWYGTQYGSTDGFTPANRYACYSSPDLQTWTPHGALLIDQEQGVYYRPYVIYNASTRKYVLWFNWYPRLWEGQFASAISETPHGPFRVVDPHVQLRGSTPGDHNLFVDDDQTAYIVYTDIKGDGVDRHAMSVEKLTPDYCGSTLIGSPTLDRKVEAPAMFKRNGIYYVVFGETCCFYTTGADARVYLSKSPLGPYEFAGDINRDHAGQIIVPGQQTDIASIPTTRGTALLWLADLWGSRLDGIKGHDIQFWSSPLEFDPDGNIRRLTRSQQFSLELQLA